MSSLGAVYSNSGNQVFYRIQPRQVITTPAKTQVTTNDVAKELISQILKTPKGQQILNRFLVQKPGFWKPILSNTRLSPSQKFKKIFGIDFLDIFQSNGVSGLGNIFEDIGNWFNTGGAERLALQIENTSSSIAQALNILRNKQNQGFNTNTQMQIQDTVTNTALTVTDFISKYGIFIIGGLAVLLLIKK